MLDSKTKHLVPNLRYFDRNTKSRDGILTRIKKKRFKVKTKSAFSSYIVLLIAHFFIISFCLTTVYVKRTTTNNKLNTFTLQKLV